MPKATTGQVEFMDFLNAYNNDPTFRAEADADPAAAVAKKGVPVPPGVELKLVRNDEETFHVVLPPDPNATLDDEVLASVAGGACKCGGCVMTKG